ncbi:MAG: hypothetical protein KJ574_03655, partial [Nanoarchaeota archaeon]|nr:hypothetical protein [Nanoarchaeota archaeon]
MFENINLQSLTGNAVTARLNAVGDLINSVSPVQFLKPTVLLLIIPLIIILIFLIRHDFVKLNVKSGNYAELVKLRRFFKILIFFSRLIIFSIILIALAQPYMEQTKTTPGNLELTLLIDNSSSMELYDTSFVPTLVDALKKRIPVKVQSIGYALDSNIGDGMLANLEEDKNLLLISDGQPTRGSELSDVAVLAGTLNSSISAMELTEKEKDAAVYISGPSKTIADVQNDYSVHIKKVGISQVHLVVAIDDAVVFDQITDKDRIAVSANYTEGYHKIIARIDGPDHFNSNNIFYKTTHVIPKPKILLVSSELAPRSTLYAFLQQVYEVEFSRTMPTDYDELDKYYAVI